jgi:hypothetical protein
MTTIDTINFWEQDSRKDSLKRWLGWTPKTPWIALREVLLDLFLLDFEELQSCGADGRKLGDSILLEIKQKAESLDN